MTDNTIDSEVRAVAKEILELGLHQYGGYEKDNANCEIIAENAITNLIAQEANRAEAASLQNILLHFKSYIKQPLIRELQDRIAQLTADKEQA